MKDIGNNNKSILCTTKHFRNLWCLRLFYPGIDQKFVKMRDEKILKINPYFTIITFIIALLDTIYQTVIKTNGKINLFSWSNTALNLSYAASAFNFIFLIFVITFKNPTLQRLLNYLNYLIVTIPLFLTRSILYRTELADNNIFSLLLIIEFFIRIAWLFFNMILFQEALVLNSTIIISLLIFTPIVMPSKNSLDDYNVPYNLFLVVFTLISYFHTKQLKESFNFNFNLKSKNRWFSNIMENMNSGFLYLKNGRINYMNNILIEKMMKNKEISNIIEDQNPNKNDTMMNLTNTFLNPNNESKRFEEIAPLVNDPVVSEKLLDVLLCDLKENTEIDSGSNKVGRSLGRKETNTNLNASNHKNNFNNANFKRSASKINSLKNNSRFTRGRTNFIRKDSLYNNDESSQNNLNSNNNPPVTGVSFGKNTVINSNSNSSSMSRNNTIYKSGRNSNADANSTLIKFSSKKFLEEIKNKYLNDRKENNINLTFNKAATFTKNPVLGVSNSNHVSLYKGNTIETHRNINTRSNLNIENNYTYGNINSIILNNTTLINNQEAHSNSDSIQSSFVLLGYKDLEVEIVDPFPNNHHASNVVNNSVRSGVDVKKEIINFEVYCRFYSTYSSQVDNVEFIFNDVTRAKTTEEKNAEFKLKSLILSKIAHEFKNPLICITELIDQIYDEVDEMKINNENNDSSDTDKSSQYGGLAHKNLPYIKSLSNYLLILVKDLDFFSQSQIGKSATLELGNADVGEILEFVTQISKGLLKKNNKQNDIEIKVDTHPNVPRYIFTDETKLKQILINLQSNAIKFTNKGSIKISMSISGDNEMLRIEVKDTGPGMRQETKDNLFKPFRKSHEKTNNIGAGLGLSICLELVNKIGGKLDYNSEMGKGN
jgi:signal transduction histidine kinase